MGSGTVALLGRDLDEDFWPPQGSGAPRRYRKTATVLAAQLDYAAVVRTPEGDMAIRPGDYLVTDDPPTHAWPVRREVFESTYEELPDG